MNRNEQFLSLIGLCLRGRNLEVGEEPVEAVARARDARVLLLASDAADNTARRVQHFAEAGQCVWLRIPFTKQELGQATGRGSAAVAAITDIGLAVAVVRRLAEMDPEKYDEDLAKLELKAKRAAERKSEAAQHEKNLRRGIKRPKKQEVPDAKEVRPAGVSSKPSGEKQRRSTGVSSGLRYFYLLQENSSSGRGLYLPIFYWWMRSTARRQRRRLPFLKLWKKDRLPMMV